MMEGEHKDMGLEQIRPFCERILKSGGTFWAKFTCNNCGARQTFEEKNTIFLKGKCEECGAISQLDRWGLLVML